MITEREFNRAAGRRLRDARKAAGISVGQLGPAVGWDPSTVTRHETGAQGFSGAQAVQYALALRVTPAWLLFGDLAPMATPRAQEPSAAVAARPDTIRSHAAEPLDRPR